MTWINFFNNNKDTTEACLYGDKNPLTKILIFCQDPTIEKNNAKNLMKIFHNLTFIFKTTQEFIPLDDNLDNFILSNKITNVFVNHLCTLHTTLGY